MLISSQDGVEFIAARNNEYLRKPDDMYFRQRLRDENNPQNGRQVLLALDLTRSIDEQVWCPHDKTLSIAALAEKPLIDSVFQPLTSELLPDTPSNYVIRQTLYDIARSENGAFHLRAAQLPISQMMPENL